jgi:apolipoprotein N-acyltransferase
MLADLLLAVGIFAITFLVLRAAEWLYHRIRHTPDWSPHWGSWVFALLLALFGLISNLGR